MWFYTGNRFLVDFLDRQRMRTNLVVVVVVVMMSVWCVVYSSQFCCEEAKRFSVNRLENQVHHSLHDFLQRYPHEDSTLLKNYLYQGIVKVYEDLSILCNKYLNRQFSFRSFCVELKELKRALDSVKEYIPTKCYITWSFRTKCEKHM